MKLFKTYKFRFMLFISLFVAEIALVVAGFSIRRMEITSIEIFSDRGAAILQKALPVIDAERFKELSNSLDDSDPFYLETYEKLYEIKSAMDCEYLYTMVHVQGDDFMYIIDGSAEFSDEENFSPIGTIENLSSYGPYPHRVLRGRQIISSDLRYQDGWGWAITVYAPIIDGGKNVVGFVACDFDGEAISELISYARNRIILIMVASVIVGIVALALYILSFFKKLNSVDDALQHISGGEKDLTARLPAGKEDELGIISDSCNTLIENLEGIIKQIKLSVEVLSDNSEALSEQNKQTLDFLKEAAEKVSAVKESAESQDSVSSDAYDTIKNMHSVILNFENEIESQNDALSSCETSVKQITKSISDSQTGIEEISEEYAAIVRETEHSKTQQALISEKILALSSEADKLSEANAVVDRIAEQTNLLAMNAAIEAAHAGEAGRGFSVVADEIRALAESSSKQSKSIKTMIDSIQSNFDEISQAWTESGHSFDSLGKKIIEMDASLASIKNSMHEEIRSAENIVSMMEILENSASSIRTSSLKMVDEGKTAYEKIENVRNSAGAILENTRLTVESLDGIKDFAASVASSSQENMRHSEELSSLLGEFTLSGEEQAAV